MKSLTRILLSGLGLQGTPSVHYFVIVCSASGEDYVVTVFRFIACLSDCLFACLSVYNLMEKYERILIQGLIAKNWRWVVSTQVLFSVVVRESSGGGVGGMFVAKLLKITWRKFFWSALEIA